MKCFEWANCPRECAGRRWDELCDFKSQAKLLCCSHLVTVTRPGIHFPSESRRYSNLLVDRPLGKYKRDAWIISDEMFNLIPYMLSHPYTTLELLAGCS